MTNNDDFDQPEYNPTEETQPPRGMTANLAEAWRSKPLFKLVVLMTAVGAIVAAGVSFLSGGNPSNNVSHFVNPPAITAPSGGPASPYLIDQTKKATQNRVDEAIENKGSALPTPIGAPTDMGDLNGGADKKNDPLNELRAQVEHLQQQQVQQQVVIRQQQQQQQNRQQEQFDDTLAQAMQRQMSQLTESWTPHGVKQVVVSKEEAAAANGANGNAAGVGANGAAGAPTNATPVQQAKTLVPAGTVSYGQLLTEANSDVPGPILASIVSGPFAGARAVGQFQIANGYADYLVLQFNLVNFKGKDYPINAIALDPNTTLGGMATEVDQRYFTRVILPAAAGFLQGFGQALGQTNSTTTTNGTSTIISQSSAGYRQGLFQGLGSAANTASQFFQEQANQTKPLVRVASGTPIGIFFVSSAMDTTLQDQQLQQQQSYLANPALAGVGALPYTGAYPGTTVTGYGGQSQLPGTQANVPYPNYANPSYNSAYRTPYSGYSGLPGTTNYGPAYTPGLGTTTYGH